MVQGKKGAVSLEVFEVTPISEVEKGVKIVFDCKGQGRISLTSTIPRLGHVQVIACIIYTGGKYDYR